MSAAHSAPFPRSRLSSACLLGYALLAASLVIAMPQRARADADPAIRSARDLKNLSLDELLDMEVTTVSKTPERLSQTASAIQVITAEEIRRSGATSLPEALRLASNLQVAQFNAHDWAITARGFNGAPLSNGSLADKLLVLIDGRAIYSPLFGGVFWDVQNVVLEDIDRIEVVSGPGGTLWGANAVNGVINVITKSAKDTQGAYVSVNAGSRLQEKAVVRYGDTVGEKLSYRVYGFRQDRRETELPTGVGVKDQWGLTQSGFRADWRPSGANAFTIQGDAYGGRDGHPSVTAMDGQNILGRFTHTFSATSDLSLQLYFDRTWRSVILTGFRDDLRTWDADLQHRFTIGSRHDLLWGLGVRAMQDRAMNSVAATFIPSQRTLKLTSGFVQDQVALRPERLTLTLGTKLEHNDYNGADWQPGVRLAWMISRSTTVWGAVSRAVHSPSRFDADLVTTSLDGDPRFKSEKLIAWEAGLRLQPMDHLSLAIATYLNHYRDVRSLNTNSSPPPGFVFANDQKVETHGFEISGTLQATHAWRLRAGYAYYHGTFTATDPAVIALSDDFEGIDPRHHATLQSLLDLGLRWHLDVSGRYVDALPVTAITPRVPAYAAADVRLWALFRAFELALVGQNLFDDRHPEFGRLVILPNVYGTATWRY